MVNYMQIQVPVAADIDVTFCVKEKPEHFKLYLNIYHS